MQAKLVNIFITATKELFGQMLGCPLQRGIPQLRPRHSPYQGITGVIDLRGTHAGMVALNLSRSAALGAASKLHDIKLTQLDSRVTDAMGEMVNIIAGRANALMQKAQLTISLPRVLKEPLHNVNFPKACVALRIPFTSYWGPLLIDVGLDPRVLMVKSSIADDATASFSFEALKLAQSEAIMVPPALSLDDLLGSGETASSEEPGRLSL